MILLTIFHLQTPRKTLYKRWPKPDSPMDQISTPGSNINSQTIDLLRFAKKDGSFKINVQSTTGSPNDLGVYESHTWRIIILTYPNPDLVSGINKPGR